ncbi:MAG: hypothetical protein DMG31_19380 [Acidobacteria bacterium]|nr:MAG: hypothetical protein DMG31_19380 [Acidobacteriota bacterium]
MWGAFVAQRSGSFLCLRIDPSAYFWGISRALVNLKLSFVSGAIVISRFPVSAVPATPAPPPAPAPMAAPLPPPASAPMIAPAPAPIAAPSAVLFPRPLLASLKVLV